MTMPHVNWRPSPNFWKGPSGYQTRAVVNHRIVGSLPSARARFLNPDGGASSHFGIGHDESGKLTIEQYVALDDSAWTNGDVREPSWSRLIPGVNPNLYTWTIEHEDGGSANRGVVEDDVWQASMELQVLLASGDPAAMRAAGITVRSDSVAREGALIPKDETGFIDHHQIAGPNKPYCFRPWLDDPGFVNGSPSRRDNLLAAVKAGAVQVEESWTQKMKRLLQEAEDRISTLRARVRRLKEQVAGLEATVAELEENGSPEQQVTIANLRNRIRKIKNYVADA